MSAEALPEWACRVAVFDTETTGISPESTRIVQAHISVLDEEGSPSNARDWLINCGIDIPAVATSVHGITTERMQAEGLPAHESIAEIVSCLAGLFSEGTPVVAYNASYDFTILDREAKRYGITPLERPRPIVDPLILDRQLDRYRKGSRNLESNAATYGVLLENAHDAAADAIAAGRLAQALARRFFDQLNIDVLELHAAQEEWALEQAASYRRYRESVGRPMYEDNDSWPVA